MWWRLGISHDVAFSAVVAGLGVISLGVGGVLSYQIYFHHPKYTYLPAGEEWQSYLAELTQTGSTTNQYASPEAYLVDISGAVEKPGVYALSESSRLQEAVLMAGGFLPEADKRYIHQEINLSSRLHDQQKIYIPLEGESVEPGEMTAFPSSQIGTSGSSAKLSLRTATAQQLEELEGIGEKRAASILAAYPYRDEADFLERSGLSRTMAQELLDTSISIE